MANKKAKAAKKGSAAVVKRGESLPTTVPDYLAQAGLEDGDVSTSDVMLPLLKLLQSNSAEVQLEEPLGKAGDFIVSSTGENLGRVLYIVPVVQKMKRIKWIPMSDGGGIECISLDGVRGSMFGDCARCGHKEFGSKGSSPACTFYYDYLSLAFREDEVGAVGDDGVVGIDGAIELSNSRGSVVLSCYMTKLKAARSLNTDILRSRLKMYTSVFRVVPKHTTKGQYSYWVFEKIERVGYVSKELYEFISEQLAPVLDSLKTTEYEIDAPEGGGNDVEAGEATDF